MARFGLVALGVGPPAVAAVNFRDVLTRHPALALVSFVAYEGLLAAVGFAGQVFGDVRDRWAKRAADGLDRRLLWRISGFERDYRAQVLSRHRFIDLKGLATRGDFTPELEQVFVDVSLMPRPAHEATGDSLAGAAPPPPPVRQSLTGFLGGPEGVALAVIGAPGTGKTTMLKHLALRLARAKGGRLPVLLFLRDHAAAIAERPDITLPEVIRATLRRLDEPEGWFDRQLGEGRCVVLLDGLDEVAGEEDRRSVSKWVEEQIAGYERNDFVLTSRPHGYLSAPLDRARVLQVRRFTGEQISRFVHGWYRAIERLSTGLDDAGVAERAEIEADDLIGRLRARPELYDLAANPLLLTMIANVHRFRGALPGSRAELYGEICQMLLWKRQEAKNVPVAEEEVTGAKKELVLCELAYEMMTERTRDIRAARAAVLLEPLLSRVAVTVPPDAFLASVITGGLLVERERGLYSFAHLTLQEHLAALHIQHRGLSDVLMESVDDGWWRETTLLYAARADPAPIVEACLDSGSVAALALAFDCQEVATELAPGTARRLDDRREYALRETVGSPRRQLMTAVTVTRWLQSTVGLGGGTVVAARPIDWGLYRLFIRESGLSRTSPLGGDGDGTAVGVSRPEVRDFVRWVNQLLPDGGWRLPTEAEADDPAFGLVARSTEHTVWVSSQGADTLPSLWVPAGREHPWSPTPPADTLAFRWGAPDRKWLTLGQVGLCGVLDSVTDERKATFWGSELAIRTEVPTRRRPAGAEREVAGRVNVLLVNRWSLPLRPESALGTVLAVLPRGDGLVRARLRVATWTFALLIDLAGPVRIQDIPSFEDGTVGHPSLEDHIARHMGGRPEAVRHASGHICPEEITSAAAGCLARMRQYWDGEDASRRVRLPALLLAEEIDRLVSTDDRELVQGLRVGALALALLAERAMDDSVLAADYRRLAAGLIARRNRLDGTTPPSEVIVLARS